MDLHQKDIDQLAFSTVARHLLTQNKVSYDLIHDRCAYRGDNGLKCAIGCLIDDRDYDVSMEGDVVRWGDENWSLDNSPLMQLSSNLAMNLQTCHDQVPPDNWLKNLREIARHYDLTFTNPKDTN